MAKQFGTEKYEMAVPPISLLAKLAKASTKSGGAFEKQFAEIRPVWVEHAFGDWGTDEHFTDGVSLDQIYADR